MSTERPKAAQMRGFTLVELLVVIGIIGILMAILVPSLGRAREMSNRAVCLSNLRAIGQSLVIYANAYRGCLPNGNPPNNWGEDAVGQAGQSQVMVAFNSIFVKKPAVFHCPSDADPVPTSIVTAVRNAPDSARVSYEFFFLWFPGHEPARLVRLSKEMKHAPLAWDQFGGDPVTPADKPELMSRNHNRSGKVSGGNVLYADGHVAWQEGNLWDDYSWPSPAKAFYPWQ